MKIVVLVDVFWNELKDKHHLLAFKHDIKKVSRKHKYVVNSTMTMTVSEHNILYLNTEWNIAYP